MPRTMWALPPTPCITPGMGGSAVASHVPPDGMDAKPVGIERRESMCVSGVALCDEKGGGGQGE